MSQDLGLKVQIQLEAAGGEVLGGRKRLRILGQGWGWRGVGVGRVRVGVEVGGGL